MVVTSIVILCIVSGVLYQIIAYAELKIKKRQ
jgi:NitT/TauT family transport system permease protein